MSYLLTLVILMFSVSIQANIIDRTCTLGQIESENYNDFSINFNGMSGVCSISISAPSRDTNGHTGFRSFIANADGGFSIFSSFYNPAGDTNSLSTGMKSYYLIPTNNQPRVYSNSETGEIYLQTAAGEKIYFNPTSGMVDSERSELNIIEDVNILHNNQGGVTVARRSGVIIEAGFRLGTTPMVSRDRSLTIRDTENHTCTVRVRDIFNSYRRVGGEYILDNVCRENQIDTVRPKATGPELRQLLERTNSRCRNVDLSTLDENRLLSQVVTEVEAINQLNPVVPPTSESSTVIRDENRLTTPALVPFTHGRHLRSDGSSTIEQ